MSKELIMVSEYQTQLPLPENVGCARIHIVGVGGGGHDEIWIVDDRLDECAARGAQPYDSEADGRAVLDALRHG